MQTVTTEKVIHETTFIADDGKVFSNKSDCLVYEAEKWLKENALDEDLRCYDVNDSNINTLISHLKYHFGGDTWASAELNDIESENVRCLLQYDKIEEDWTLRPLSALIVEAQIALDDLKEYEKL